MQLALGLGLAIFYLGLSQRLIQLFPASGFVLGWFFVPAFMMIATGFSAHFICRLLPRRWETDRPYGQAPRRVHLSWRAAVRAPVMLPWILFPGNFLWLMRADPVFRPILWSVGAAAPAIVALLVLRVRGKIRLLRWGEVANAIVHQRDDEEEPNNRVFFSFTTRDGTEVSGWGWDLGYKVPVGGSLPVFYDAKDPTRHVAGCSCWFEAD